MAFDLNGLTPIAQGGTEGPDIWRYTSTDTLATIRVAGYFNEYVNELKVNDLLLVVSSTGGTPVLSWNYVNSNDGTTVDVTDGDVIAATDTD